MKQKLALLLAGLLVGGLLMSVVPVSAHHQPGFRRLVQRVNQLTTRVDRLQRMVNNRTQQLNRFGDYEGFVIGEQVLSLCPAGSTATWQDTEVTTPDGDPISWIDTCLSEAGAAARSSRRQLQRMFGP